MDPIEATIARTILNTLLSSVLRYSTGKGIGWFVGAVLGSGGNNQDGEILRELNEIRQTLDQVLQIEQQIQQELKELAAELKFEINAVSIQGAVSGIRSVYEAARSLDKDSKKSAKDVLDSSRDPEQIPRQIEIISSAVLGNLATDSLIEQWANLVTLRSVANPYDPRDVDPKSSLSTGYVAIERYFRYLITIQLKGIILETNAYHADNDPKGAERQLNLRLQSLLLQNEQFLKAVEQFTVNYCYDLTLFGLINGPHGQRLSSVKDVEPLTDPIARADQFLTNSHPAEEQTLRVRIWNGAGDGSNGHHPFNTHASDQVPDLTLADPAGQKKPITAENSPMTPTMFPRRNDAQWSLLRYTYRNLDKTVGLRRLDPMPEFDTERNYDGYMSWKLFQQYTGELVQFDFDAKATPGSQVIRDSDGKYLHTVVSGVPGNLNVALTRTRGLHLNLSRQPR